MASRFVHLHTHSHYSFLQALPKLDELVAKAKAAGMDALGVTDAGNMHGAIEFYQAAEKGGIKPILGVDTYLAPRTRFDKDHALDAKRSRIVLLAENNDGYKNILALVTKSWTEGFFDRPRADKDLLREHAKDVIAILPSFASDVSQLLRAGNKEGAAAALDEFKSIFGPDHLFLEVTHHPHVEGHEALMQQVIALAKESGVQLVAQHDVYYLEPDDQEPTEILRRIGQGDRGRNEQEDFSFLSEEKALELFKDIPEAIDNTRAIAERCNVSFELGKFVFPVFELPEGVTADEQLRKLCLAGLEKRDLVGDEKALERLDYELGIVAYKGYAAYFLVVEDLIRYARESGILYNIRGSVAGSMTTYLLGITKLNPLEYKIPFERFLNPDRPSAPDIDMDFADNRRDDVIAYAREKYGADHVAQIGTFGTMMARAAVRDVARALGHAYATGDRIAKLIPQGSQGFPMTIDKALELEPDLKSVYDEDEDAHEVLDLARRIEGCVRHVGVHAAGVVISPKPLIEYTALQPDPKSIEKEGGKLITQYDMYSVGEDGVGLTKFDFLGIRNLTILGDAVERVKKRRDIDVDLEAIPLDDPKTYRMLARGETIGLFQLNGSGMTKWLMELKPTTIHDINAMVALYRPGPMQFIPDYIARKHGKVPITYLDPALEHILAPTYGILVYQDDLLIMANELAGYTWGEVDKFRKAVGKKIPEEMQKQKNKFIQGCIDTSGWSEAKAKDIWAWIEPFAAYGFNKSHSASYGRVAYQTAYMKANFPAEYLAAVLTAEGGDTEKIAEIVAEAKRMDIPLLPPDVNESGTDFTVVITQEKNPAAPNRSDTSEPGVAQRDGASGADFSAEKYRAPGEDVPSEQAPAQKEKDAIRFGLSSIKNFGEGIANAILAERAAHGPFASLADFLSRVGDRNLNRKSLESLIKCGALDSLLPPNRFRMTLLENIEGLLAYHREATAVAPQDSLFGATLGAPELVLPEGEPVSLSEQLAWEKELLGIYISGHPLDAFPKYTNKTLFPIVRLLSEPLAGRTLALPVLIAAVRPILTKGGEKMAFIRLEDKTGSIEAVAFPKLFKEHAALLAEDQCVLIQGKVSDRNGERSLALEGVKGL